MLSIVFSCYNEGTNPFFAESLKQLLLLQEKISLEVICVDGGSTDCTLSLIRDHGFSVIAGTETSRGARYHTGAERASNELLLFHHPRSIISVAGIIHLATHARTFQWGAFTHRFDSPHPVLTFTSWYSNHVRGDLRSIYYLDHCLFVRKELLNKIGGFPQTEIFEDTELCLRLRKHSPGVRLPFTSTTSSVRFLNNGITKQSLLNLKMKIKYLLNSDRTTMNKSYEKDLNLNTNAEED
ncbi:MAG TPA: glycosyltransferase [Bacteriovoracaceae bacterium]|nr:glycosyltransferase [Bacteriovoracaceae bacterium]